MEKKVVADEKTTDGIGPVSGEFYVYDRDREVLRRLGTVQLLTDYLDDNGGIRVYRDGIRVYNYGEPGDDWLGLDLRRVNAPTRGISRNIILGAVQLSIWSFLDNLLTAMRPTDYAIFPIKLLVIGMLVAATSCMTALTAESEDDPAKLMPRGFVRGMLSIMLASGLLSLVA